MAAAVAAAGDVRVTVLGPSMPADQLGRRLEAGDVDVLALSCTLPTNLLGAARCVIAAHRVGVPVIAGGARSAVIRTVLTRSGPTTGLSTPPHS